jgi:hypothetical protein
LDHHLAISFHKEERKQEPVEPVDAPREGFGKYKNKQRAISLKLGKAELWFFSTAHLPNKIYKTIKFYVDISYSCRVLSRTNFIV